MRQMAEAAVAEAEARTTSGGRPERDRARRPHLNNCCTSSGASSGVLVEPWRLRDAGGGGGGGEGERSERE